MTQAEFLDDRQGRTFADVVSDPDAEERQKSY